MCIRPLIRTGLQGLQPNYSGESNTLWNTGILLTRVNEIIGQNPTSMCSTFRIDSTRSAIREGHRWGHLYRVFTSAIKFGHHSAPQLILSRKYLDMARQKNSHHKHHKQKHRKKKYRSSSPANRFVRGVVTPRVVRFLSLESRTPRLLTQSRVAK